MATASQRVRLVVGLGNPGPRYRLTRHNLGFEVVERLLARRGVTPTRRFEGRAATATEPLGTVTFLMPETFMNDSGRAVAMARRRLGLTPGEVLVVHDDLDLPVGAVRVRPRGSSGGHNGLKSIIAALGGEGFGRVRLGVGRPPGEGEDVIRYVLERFAPAERPLVDDALERACQAVECVLEAGYEEAMNRFNGAGRSMPPAGGRLDGPLSE
jgi:peptidyl-tRNA hydrolase, PTH1 family